MKAHPLLVAGMLVVVTGLAGAENKPKSVLKPRSSEPKSSYVVRPSSQTVRKREALLTLSQDPDVASAGEKLQRALTDEDVMSRTIAAQGLGQIRYRQAIPRLGQVLATDTNPEVREAAAASLKQMGDPSAIDPLVKGLGDAAPPVRVASLLGLATYRDVRVQEAVAARTKDPSADVRRSALFALGQIQARVSAPAVEDLFRDADPTVRAVAAQTAGLLRSTGSVAGLTGLLKDEKAVQVSAARSLAMLGDGSGYEVAEALVRDEDLAVRLLAIDALGWSKNPQAGKTLNALLENTPPNSRVAVQESITRHQQLRKKR